MTLKKAFQLIVPWWRSEERILAWSGTVGLLIWCFVSVYIAVIFNEWTQGFYGSIEQKNFDAFIHQTILFVPLLTATLIDFCGRWFVARWLAFRWRQWYTQKLQRDWLETQGYYRIPLAGHTLDNPDQRISQDVNNVCAVTMDLFQVIVRDGMNAVTFSIILWGISKGIVLPYFHVEIPGVLFWAAFLYATIGTIVMLYIGYPMIGLDVEQEKREANFRYRLMRIHERREEILKLLGEAAEEKSLKEAFARIRSNYYTIMKLTIYMNGFVNFFMNGNMFIPLIIVGPAYFSGLMTMAILMQIRSMFGEVQQSFSLIVNNYFQMADWIASMKRLNEFHAKIDDARTKANTVASGDCVVIQNLDIFTRRGDKILNLPGLSLKKGERKMIMGPSGVGKTSLFRVLRGAYPYYEGEVECPHNLMMIPQRPYMPLGTLAECLCYPHSPQNYGDKVIKDVMDKCELTHLGGKLEEVDDYQNCLSLGEQQRINFARAILHKPQWLLMDEPTSSVNGELAEKLMKTLLRELPDTGILIISHSEDLQCYTHEVIRVAA